MANSVNLSALTQYTDQLSHKLIHDAVLEGDTLNSGVTLLTGMKGEQAIPYLTSNLVMQAGGCDADIAGSVAITQRTVKVLPISVKEKICPDDFDPYFLGMKQKAGSYNEEGPAEFQQVYTAKKLNDLKANIDVLFWKGSLSGTYSSTYNQIDGLLWQLEGTSATSSVIRAGATYSGAPTINNVADIIDSMTLARPENILDKDDNTLFVPFAAYDLYVMHLMKTNNFHFTGDEQKHKGFQIPGRNVFIKPTKGLNGLNKMLLTPASNIIWATDLTDDSEHFKFVFDPITDNLYFKSKFKLGAQVYFPQHCVLYKG